MSERSMIFDGLLHKTLVKKKRATSVISDVKNVDKSILLILQSTSQDGIGQYEIDVYKENLPISPEWLKSNLGAEVIINSQINIIAKNQSKFYKAIKSVLKNIFKKG